MDALLEILWKSTNNDERKVASARLRHIQESTPEAFLTYTWEVISSPTVTTAVRFFMASTVAEFVEQSWHNGVPKDVQLNMIDRYLQLLLTENFPLLTLLRKVSLVLALMVTRSGVKAAPGALPAAMERTATALADAAVRSACNINPNTVELTTQSLFVLHIFLKEAQKKRVGGVFPKLCTLLVPVMSTLFSASTSWDHVAHYLPFLYLLKCALRVFGVGVFEVSFYAYLLDTTWRFARALSAMDPQQPQQRQCRQRLLEYAIKVQARMVDVFSSRLQELSPAFFIQVQQDGGSDYSLFGFIDAIIRCPVGDVTTEKMLCRSMHILTMMFHTESYDAFTAACFAALANSPLLEHMVESVILLLADDTSAATRRAWDVQPDQYVEELEAQWQDDNSVQDCAERLLLALTASTYCDTGSLAVVWRVVNSLLEGNDVGQVTAALRAIGAGCYTMSVGQYSENYLAFLTGKLLPLIANAAATSNGNNNNNNNNNSACVGSQTSLFVLRRVVWVVGMWCETVSDVTLRCQVHMALGSLLQPTTHIVILLCTFGSIGKFIDDVGFTPAEITPECVRNILFWIQHLLPRLHSQSAVKGLASLVYSMYTRHILDAGSMGMVLDVLLPAVYRFVSEAQATGNANVIENDDTNNNSNDNNTDSNNDKEEEEGLDVKAVGTLLDSIGACVTIAAPEVCDRVWSLFPTVVVPCTVSGGKLTIWVEDQAWELLLTMSRVAHVWHSFTRDALAWCLENMQRDMSLLHMVVRCAYTLLLLCPEPMAYMTVGLMDHALAVLIQTPSREVEIAHFALLGAVLRRGDESLRCHFLKCALDPFLSSDSVQSDLYSLHLAVLLSWCVPPFGEEATVLVLAQVVSQHPNAASFAERLVLLIDISPSALVTKELVGLIQLMLQRLQPLLQVTDVQMMQCAIAEIETVDVPKAEDLIREKKNSDSVDGDVHNDDDMMARDSVEMLLELLGDESALDMPLHVHRLLSVFGINVT